MPNKRTSQLTDFMSYQLSMDASVGRNLPLTLSQPIMTQVWGTRTLQECLYSVLYTKQQSGRVTACWWKWHTAGWWGKAMILPARTIIKGHYQSQTMNSKAQVSAILATAGNFYCEELECMIFNFTLSFTCATHLVPFQDTSSHVIFSHKIHIRAGVSFCCKEDSPRNLSLYNGSSS